MAGARHGGARRGGARQGTAGFIGALSFGSSATWRSELHRPRRARDALAGRPAASTAGVRAVGDPDPCNRGWNGGPPRLHAVAPESRARATKSLRSAVSGSAWSQLLTVLPLQVGKSGGGGGNGLPTIWQGPRCRSERVYLAHGQPRPSTRYAGPPLRSGPSGDCRARPCGMLLRASQKAGPPSTRRSAAHGKPLSCRGEPLQQTRKTGPERTHPARPVRTPGATVEDRLMWPRSRHGANRNRRGHGALRRRRSAGGRPPSAEPGRGHDRGLAATGTCRG